MSWAAIAASVVGVGLSAGMAAATAPDFADPKKSSRKTVMAALMALPQQRRIEMAARLGIPIDFETGRKKKTWGEVPIAQALADGQINQTEYNRLKNAGEETVTVQTGWEGETQHADFTGYGDADIQGQLQRRLAEGMLDLQKKYGPEFIQEALKQQELADPQGTAARRMLAEQINAMADRERDRPVPDALDAQISGELGLGRGLGDDERAAIVSTLAGRGGTTLTADDVAGGLKDGPEGDARLSERIGRALGYYGSGITPADVEYRERQQNLSNMASFLGGRTPQSQFQSLSGGQQGAAPMPQAAGLPNLPGNLNQIGQNAGLQQYQLGVKQAANEVSPWFAGLNMAVKGAQVAGQAGWKPFGQG